MPKLYLVVSPNGNIARVAKNLSDVEDLRPQEAADGTPLFNGYEVFAIDVSAPWAEERAAKKIDLQKLFGGKL
jgi:hypothetical protein